MKKYSLIVLAFVAGIATVSLLSWKKSDKLPPGEIANIRWEVQNLMSKHEYYHAAAMNLEEVDALWVDRDGEYAESATFASPMWVMNGIETIRNAYGKENHTRKEAALKKLSEIDPSVENIPENLGAGYEWVMHTSTTPVIEVAGDGKTAKGIWYSPGMGLMTQIIDGKPQVKGTFFWEKYGGDFIKENGVWKIWHLQMAYDFTPSVSDGGNWTDFSKKNEAVQAGEQEDGPMMMKELPPGFSKPKYSYPNYSPQRPGIIYPKIPEPYYTFSETFSY